jgi:hypothetical protein
VEDAAGMPYSNGKNYQKFYVPLQMLTPLAQVADSGHAM